ncbi:O-antigen polymerase [uncultured Cetobacterium sp.]|uniref:O-antigen polymerase n=1 Tax=uncultured Cetobacterium sp. TaxID=527638 RepID=UPI00261AFEE9|nr:O-antigen polymerase [uncultured Cetobacterium sp.]
MNEIYFIGLIFIIVSLFLIKDLYFRMFSLVYLIYYVIVPLFWLNYPIKGYFPIQISKEIKHIKILYDISPYIFFSYIAYFLGFIIIGSKKNVIRNKKINIKVIKIYGLFSLIIGIISITILVYNFGNFITAIPKIINLRWINSNTYIPFEFMRIFNPFVIVAFYVYYSLNKKKYMLLSFIASIYFLILQSGRSHVLYFIFPIVYFKYINSKKTKQIYYILLLVIVIIILTLYGDEIRKYFMNIPMNIKKNSLEENISKFIIQLSFPCFNLIRLFREGNILRYGQDIFVIFNIIPGITMESLWQLNTKLFESFNAGVPVDILSFGIYQFGKIGMFIVMFIMGITTKLISRYFKRRKHIIYKLLEYRISILYAFIVINFDTEVFIRSGLPYIFGIIIFKILGERNESRINIRNATRSYKNGSSIS